MNSVAAWFMNPQHRLFVITQVVCVCTALCFVALDLFTGWLPPPGVAIGLIAVIAATMSIHNEMHRSHKALWMLIIGAFLIIELFAIAHERTATMKKSDALVRASTEAVETATKSLGEITGGKSFAVVFPVLLTSIHHGKDFPLAAYIDGKYPLSDVWIQRFDTDPNAITSQQMSEFFERPDAQGPRIHIRIIRSGLAAVLSPIAITPKMEGENIYHFGVDARNGTTQEELRIRKNPVSKAWEYSLTVKDDTGKVLLSQPWVQPQALGTKPQ